MHFVSLLMSRKVGGRIVITRALEAMDNMSATLSTAAEAPYPRIHHVNYLINPIAQQ